MATVDRQGGAMRRTGHPRHRADAPVDGMPDRVAQSEAPARRTGSAGGGPTRIFVSGAAYGFLSTEPVRADGPVRTLRVPPPAVLPDSNQESSGATILKMPKESTPGVDAHVSRLGNKNESGTTLPSGGREAAGQSVEGAQEWELSSVSNGVGLGQELSELRSLTRVLEETYDRIDRLVLDLEESLAVASRLAVRARERDSSTSPEPETRSA